MMKKIISVLLIVTIAVFAIPASFTAAESYRYIGDVDGDDTVSILDATLIQKQLASLHSFTKWQKNLGDVDNSQTTDIIDATLIQKRLASLVEGFYKERIQSWKSEIYGIESINSENTYLLNTQYSFSISATQRPIPDDFQVLVDQKVILEKGEETSFTCTVTETGVHHIRAYCYGAWGNIDSCLLTIIVTDPDTAAKPSVDKIVYDSSTGLINVTASGGTAPYQYCYTIRQVPPPPPEHGPEFTDASFVFKMDTDGSYYLYCDFCDDPDVHVPTYHLSKDLYYQLEVQALDQKGALSQVKSIYIQK